jgi:hypothetical protein
MKTLYFISYSIMRYQQFCAAICKQGSNEYEVSTNLKNDE